MDRRWKSHDRHAHTARGNRERGFFRYSGNTSRRSRISIQHVLLRPKTTWRQKSNPGGHDKRAIRPGKCRAKRLDGTPIRLGGPRIIGKIVNEGGMNHAVRCRRSASQALKIIERAAVHIRAGRGERRSGCIGASQAQDLVPGSYKLADDGGADESGRAGNENSHRKFLH